MQKGEFFVEKGGKKLAEKKGETKKRRRKKNVLLSGPEPEMGKVGGQEKSWRHWGGCWRISPASPSCSAGGLNRQQLLKIGGIWSPVKILSEKILFSKRKKESEEKNCTQYNKFSLIEKSLDPLFFWSRNRYTMKIGGKCVPSKLRSNEELLKNFHGEDEEKYCSSKYHADYNFSLERRICLNWHKHH